MASDCKNFNLIRREIINYLREAKVIIFSHKVDIFIFPFVIPFVFLLRVLSPVIKVKLGYFRNQDRFGHFVQDTSYEVCRNKLDKRTKYIYWIDKNVANKEWLLVVKKYITINNFIRPIEKMNRLIPFGGSSSIRPLIDENHLSRDVNGLISSNQPLFKFGKKEEKIVADFFENEDANCEKFVCLMVRDSLYLTGFMGHTDEEIKYHSYRDSEINTYKVAVNYLISLGYTVVRMGAHQKTPMDIVDSNFIDYAFSDQRNDKLDVLLPYYSKFCIGAASGIDALSLAYSKPSLYINAMPLFHINSERNLLWNPKNLFWKESGMQLTLSETLEHQYMDSDKYKEAGVIIKDLNEEEILDAVKEFIYFKVENNRYSLSDDKKQKIFWNLMLNSPFNDFYVYINPKCRISKGWIDRIIN